MKRLSSASAGVFLIGLLSGIVAVLELKTKPIGPTWIGDYLKTCALSIGVMALGGFGFIVSELKR